MPWFPHPCQAVSSVLALEGCRLARASFGIQRLLFDRAPADSHDALSVFEAKVVVLF